MALALWAAPLPLAAQVAASCAPPNPMPVPRAVPMARGEQVQPNGTGGYLLALSWSPQYCAGVRNPSSAQNRDQCGSEARYGWILHGLWPQSAKGPPPRWCRAAKIVPKEVLRQHFCTTPSVQLMQSQWAKHGVCMGGNVADYFAQGTSDAMFAVSTDRQGWLTEVRLCLDARMRPMRCSTANQGLLGGRQIWVRPPR
jgi:ribonuclease T2